MAQSAEVAVRVTDFKWFREILVRGGDLIASLEGEDLSDDARRTLRSFAAAYRDDGADGDCEGSDLLPP